MRSMSIDVAVVRKVARGVTAGMLLFWGVFYAGHVWDWLLHRWPMIVQRWPMTPPPMVWYQLTVGVLLLAGLSISFRRELIGSLLTIIAAVLLLANLSVLYVPLASLPAVLHLYCWYAERREFSRLPYPASRAAPSLRPAAEPQCERALSLSA